MCRKSKRLGPEPKVWPDCGIWRELASLLSDAVRPFTSSVDHRVAKQTPLTPEQSKWSCYIAFFIFLMIALSLLLTLALGLSHADGAAPAPAPTPSGASSVRSAFQQTNNLTGSIPHILSNQNDMQVHILPIGATIQRVIVPNAEGIAEDVVLGYDDPTQYQTDNSPYFGGIVGRVANRIANATFTLNGTQYQLGANDRGNTLHGGFDPLFENSTWDVLDASSTYIKLNFVSPAGAQGFPGTLRVNATYTLTADNQLQLVIQATTDATTPINLAQHSYFNLNSEASGKDILNHAIFIDGDYITPVDATQIPTGSLLPVNNTPFDFTSLRQIGSQIKGVTFPPPNFGYDFNWALFGYGYNASNLTHNGAISSDVKHAVTLHSPASGRYMDLYTNMPGLQFYSGNNLNGSTIGKGGFAYQQYGGLALESQVWPDFLHEPRFPQSILEPGQVYTHKWYLRFYTKPGAAAPAPAPVAVANATPIAQAPAELHTASIP